MVCLVATDLGGLDAYPSPTTPVELTPTSGRKSPIWRLRKVKQDTTVAGTSTSATTVHADYSFQDTAGIKRTGEVDFLSKPQKGDVLEVMYDPEDPTVNETVKGGSVVGRIVNYSAVFIIFGAGGVFLILASLELLPI